MKSIRTRELLTLFLGDLLALIFSLWLTLLIRYGQIPSLHLFESHLVPFSILFLVWLVMFLISGLYDQHTSLFRAKLPDKILKAQVSNIVIAALFFFFVPIFGIAPKTNLVLYLIVSFCLIVFWRLELFPKLAPKKRGEALLITGGLEFRELLKEVSDNPRYPFIFSATVKIDKLEGGSLGDRIFAVLRNPRLSYAVLDINHPKLANILPHLYKPIFSNVQFIDVRDLYEEIFERLPLSVLNDTRGIEEITKHNQSVLYEITKRFSDILGAVVLGIITVASAPFIWLFMRIEGPGSLFITQDRIGKNGTKMKVYKFRTMLFNDSASASWVGEGRNSITRVGGILRKTSLDEFPQFINILRGELSLIGPRNDIEGLGQKLYEAIPCYSFRYTVKPGITGWAQINQQYESGNISPQSVEETKIRLMYDFYYVKNRSLTLDAIIALKTLKKMVFRVSH